MISITVYIEHFMKGYKAYVPLLPDLKIFGSDFMNIETEIMESIKNHLNTLPREDVPIFFKTNFSLIIKTVE